MGFLNAVSLLVVFSFFQTEAVLPSRENITSNGNVTLTSSSNVTGERINQTVIPQIKNTTKEIQNHTKSNTESASEPILEKKTPFGRENYGETYKNILHTLNLEHGIKMQDLNVLLLKLGLHNCSRRSSHRVKQYKISLCFIAIIYFAIVQLDIHFYSVIKLKS